MVHRADPDIAEDALLTTVNAITTTGTLLVIPSFKFLYTSAIASQKSPLLSLCPMISLREPRFWIEGIVSFGEMVHGSFYFECWP